MTTQPPEWHYERATSLMARVSELDSLLPIAKALTAQAQVHATLATCPDWHAEDEWPDDEVTRGYISPRRLETRTATGDRL